MAFLSEGIYWSTELLYTLHSLCWTKIQFTRAGFHNKRDTPSCIKICNPFHNVPSFDKKKTLSASNILPTEATGLSKCCENDGSVSSPGEEQFPAGSGSTHPPARSGHHAAGDEILWSTCTPRHMAQPPAVPTRLSWTWGTEKSTHTNNQNACPAMLDWGLGGGGGGGVLWVRGRRQQEVRSGWVRKRDERQDTHDVQSTLHSLIQDK